MTSSTYNVPLISLFNCSGLIRSCIQPSITRLGILLLLFDVYLTWSQIEALPQHAISSSPIPHLPVLLQYAFYLVLCTLITLVQHFTIRSLAASELFNGHNNSNASKSSYTDEVDPRPGPNSISTALLVSSCMKLFPILMIVWKYDDAGGSVKKGVEWAVAVQNLEAIRILLGCGYVSAGVLVGAGWFASWVVRVLLVSVFGLGGSGGG